MKLRLLDLVACPECGGDLSLGDAEGAADGEIVSGRLECTVCRRGYPIRKGVPRLLPDDLSPIERKTSMAFGWQWHKFTELHDEYEAQFLDWIHPLEASFFRGKVVLDAGCGNGRHAYYAATYGAREVVAMDLSVAVDTAAENTRTLPNLHVVQGDIHHPPFKRNDRGGPFDFVYTIGVLHHLPDPAAGFRSLVQLVRPDGAIFAWVYGKENNAIVHRFVNPMRATVSSRVPPSLLPVIAWPLSVALQGVVKGVYRPLHGRKLFASLPSHDYLYSISGFNFRRNYNIVFDHLVAPVAFYVSRDEFESWFRSAALEDVRISWRNQNSWRGFGRVAAQHRTDGRFEGRRQPARMSSA